MERRSFLKMSAAMGCAATVSGCNSSSSDVEVVPPTPPVGSDEKLNWSACLVNCGSNCPIKVFTKDGVITRIETDFETTDEYGVNHQVRACARGRSLKQRTYAPDRLKTPMKRVGKRGEGKFVPISWDEAASTIASELQRITESYGNKSIFTTYGSGAYYGFESRSNFHRLLNLNGGYLKYYGNYSWWQQTAAAKATWASGSTTGSSLLTLKDSDLFIGIGYNPSEMRQSGSGEGYDYLQALQANPELEVIMVDPRYTDSMAGKEDQWLAIRPGTDAAFAEGIAYEMISSGWVDANSKAFLDQFCIGFDKASLEQVVAEFEASGDAVKMGFAANIDPENNYKDYILGEGKFAGEAKTAARAAGICGISEANIKNVASKIMAASAPYIITGAGVNRHANGEQAMRACYMLPLLTGKVGQPGVTNGGLPAQSSLGRAGLPELTNPITEKISFYTWADAVERGETMTGRKDGVTGTADLDTPLGANIKAIFSINGNALINQHSDCNYSAKVLEDDTKAELVVVCDCWMTSTAKFADIILPDTSWLETNDLVNDSYASGNMGYLTAMSTSIEPLWECKSMFEICSMIADKMGLGEAFTEGKDQAAWLEELYQSTLTNPKNANAEPPLPATFVEAQQQGVFRSFDSTVRISLDSFVNGGEPLGTPSGKIEMYSIDWAQKAVEYELDGSILGHEIDPLPKYQITWDGYEDTATAADYPLQLMGYHTKGRTHSSYHNVPWLREAVEDAVWMNPSDAEARGLIQGEKVLVWNDRGTIELPVRVTPRVAPGVAALGQGAWYQPDPNRMGPSGHPIDIGGCINTLTRYLPTPVCKGNPQHTNRVQIAKA
ncbi:DMSO/selenate family reductase complex A subunit [Shewanella gelidii]|uniref:Dimethyl sulfoxide reductase subunit A n=1 Tax=Shewanella gelidii TaxID=1642821 RepID=A0A917NDL9_9GAMM|nr:DMSO/selenate family reductase complex A subunit [Shewanella gelidii]MCL1099595.1 molybdopterin-dependent oxidoreductase [Shewanella gelidii]GGI92627.1 dimethyl sulfoxide reductase subunit A [Shewanella gelidii]